VERQALSDQEAQSHEFFRSKKSDCCYFDGQRLRSFNRAKAWKTDCQPIHPKIRTNSDAFGYRISSMFIQSGATRTKPAFSMTESGILSPDIIGFGSTFHVSIR
jgi:hypothetical protein